MTAPTTFCTVCCLDCQRYGLPVGSYRPQLSPAVTDKGDTAQNNSADHVDYEKRPDLLLSNVIAPNVCDTAEDADDTDSDQHSVEGDGSNIVFQYSHPHSSFSSCMNLSSFERQKLVIRLTRFSFFCETTIVYYF